MTSELKPHGSIMAGLVATALILGGLAILGMLTIGVTR